MNLQYITDGDGATTGVFIPIKEWREIKIKYKDIDEGYPEIPEWHKIIVSERMAQYASDPSKVLDFTKTIDEIEKDL